MATPWRSEAEREEYLKNQSEQEKKHCKDCVYYEVCPLGLMIKGKTGTCLKFKNKADYVEVKHGEWKERKIIIMDNEITAVRCTACNLTSNSESLYCPNCGAKMDGGADNGNTVEK